ncbi:MAG: hypothetical protein JJ911_07785 [Rhizobiaceae bacterium]|nr:hypothetical protein [Rhizobiaceae bacterium]
MKMTGSQLKAARALADVGQVALAAAAGVNVNTIRNMEAAGDAIVRVRLDTLLRVQEALEATGVIFLDAGEVKGGGPGVRLAK